MALPTGGVIDFTDCDSTSNEPKAVVDIETPSLFTDRDWIRIPLTSVEMWVNSNGPAMINRSAKITAINNFEPSPKDIKYAFTEENTDVFGGGLFVSDAQEEVTSLDFLLGQNIDAVSEEIAPNIEESDLQFGGAFPLARVYFYDSQIDEYTISHFGYIGSYGPAESSIARKFWIYDTADLIRRIPVGKVFSKPTVGTLFDFIANGTDDTDNAVGVNNATPIPLNGISAPNKSQLTQRQLGVPADDDGLFAGAVEDVLQRASFGVFGNDTENNVKGRQSFVRNRNNMVDVYNTVARFLDAQWYFRPQDDGVVLEFRTNISSTNYSRLFTDTSLIDSEDQFTVETTENNALIDIKPINTIRVNGESKYLSDEQREQQEETNRQFTDGIVEFIEGSGVNTPFTSKYPSVKLRYEPLYKRAGNKELGPTNVDAPTSTIDETKRYVIDEFMKHLRETTEGSITLRGDPFVLPRDYIRTVPSCAGESVDAIPITYEVNEVYHKRTSGEPYTTELGVHAAVNGNIDSDDWTVTGEYKQAQ